MSFNVFEQQRQQLSQKQHNEPQNHSHLASSAPIIVKVYNDKQIRRFRLSISTDFLGLQNEIVDANRKNSNSQICISYRNFQGLWCTISSEQDWVNIKSQYISKKKKSPLALRVDYRKQQILQRKNDSNIQQILNKPANLILNELKHFKQHKSPTLAQRRGRRPIFRGNWRVQQSNKSPLIIKYSKNNIKDIPLRNNFFSSYSSTLTFFVNNEKHELNNVSPEIKLVEYLRTNGLTGTKIGCGEGGCGACTVVLSTSATQNGKVNTSSRAINACLHPLASLDGMYVTTTEGIGSQHSGFHAIQQRLAENDGSQCGYCSPGFVMSMYGLLQKNPTPSQQTIEDHFDGNICRCTGYRPILKTMHTFGKNSIRYQTEEKKEKKKLDPSNMLPLTLPKCYIASDDSSAWFSPKLLSDVYSLIETHSDYPLRLTVGNTSIGVVKYYPFHESDDPRIYIDLTRIPELAQIKTMSDHMEFGAAVTLSLMIEVMSTKKDQNYVALVRHLKLVANHQVRNAACWAGNLMIAKTHPDFPSDLVTIFTAVGATVCVTDGKNTFWYGIPDFLNKKLGVTYILKTIRIPFAGSVQYFDSWKVADRHQNAHALVNAGFSFTYNQSPKTIKSAILVFGNITEGPFICHQTSEILIGKPLTQDTLNAALSVLDKECIPTDSKDPDPTWVIVDKNYRKSLALSLFFKFFLEQIGQFSTLPERVVSASKHYERAISKGTQAFTPDKSEEPVSYPKVKLEATRQASGEAIYTDDIAVPQNCVYAAYVLSTQPLATVITIDASQALAIEGVIDFISASTIKDIGGVNECGDFPGDEEVFASTEVKSFGQPIGLIVATSQAIANKAAKKVRIKYGATKDAPLLTLKDAITKQAFYKDIEGLCPDLVVGDVEAGFAASDHVLEGEFTSGGQLHFYMETQSSTVIPEENGVFRAHCSTQDLNLNGNHLAVVLNVKQHKIVMETRRCGGAFGGKISRSIPPLMAVGVAAAALRRPVRMQLDRNIDCDMNGGRLDKIYKFKIGFMKDGSIKAYHIQFFGNGGWTNGDSFGCMQMAMLWADNTYHIPNVLVQGKICIQNRPTTTACRAPGVLESTYAIELIIETIATSLNMTPSEVREVNFYKNGDTTIVGDVIVDLTLPKIWSQVKSQSNWTQRKADVQKFNDSNRWRKRGIRISPVKYGASPGFYVENVLLNVNADGTICLTHTGIELGQGINTKVVQTIAYSLGIKMDMIETFKNSTEKISRVSTTGGSATSESVCGAAIDACTKLKALLEPIKKDKPTATWEELCGYAFDPGYPINPNMTVNGFWAPGPSSASGFDYYVYGAACSEVEVDILTGQVEILRVDIVYDCGQSLNPAIDIGQVEGGFMMGMGFFFSESVLSNTTTGRLITNGTWEYKPPCSQDIPIEFNVTFLDNTRNKAKNSVLGSKLTGEPPLILSNSVYFATIDAIQAARAETGAKHEALILNSPITVDKIQQACLVNHAQFIIDPKKNVY